MLYPTFKTVFGRCSTYTHFYEWINPVTDEGGGAYPFRTGISAVRIAIADIIEKIRKESSFVPTTKKW